MPDRVRVFLLTVFVVDDLVALVVIAVVYSDEIVLMPLVVAVGRVRAAAGRRPAADAAALGCSSCSASSSGRRCGRSGVDPVVAGLAIGLAAPAYTPSRDDLEEATGLVREFREQPTPELARSATAGLTATLSPNARLQTFYHPWTSYVIVPLFALANAGIVLDGGFLAHAYTTPITLGVLVGYVVGKPVAVVGDLVGGDPAEPRPDPAAGGLGRGAGQRHDRRDRLHRRAAHRDPGLRRRPSSPRPSSARCRRCVVASLLTWVVFRLAGLLPPERRARALLGDTSLIQDLVPAVDPERDHIRGPDDAPITVIEFGDFECPYCGQAEPVVRELLDRHRHPLRLAAPAADRRAPARPARRRGGRGGGRAGRVLGDARPAARRTRTSCARQDLLRYAGQLGLDAERFHDELEHGVHEARVAQDVESADLSGVSGTPTFFINGQRHYGAFDLAHPDEGHQGRPRADAACA